MPTILGMNFGRGFFWGGGRPETLEKKAEKIVDKFHHQISLRNVPAMFLIFAGPKYNIHPKSALQNLGLKK